ncbi:MAG: AraC family transcriptional regulator [Planctomycetota bacterium]|jgi:AraC-like DNA-binding protein|nr:AraC family transcriptional regulator [Planctomycetota bacterium]
MLALGTERVSPPLDRCPEIHALGVGHPRMATLRYCLPEVWSLVFVRYAMLATIDGVDYAIKPGHVMLMPPGVSKVYRITSSDARHLYVHFSLPGNATDTALPVVTDCSQDYAAIDGALSEALACRQHQAQRAAVRIWDILFRLSDALRPHADNTDEHPALAALERQIELSLDTTLSIVSLAKHVGVSHGHLATLFRQHRGETIVAYIRRRRMERARTLLLHSTAKIKDVAAEVGIPDLQAFNKSMRKQFGHGPRELRERAPDLPAD